MNRKAGIAAKTKTAFCSKMNPIDFLVSVELVWAMGSSFGGGASSCVPDLLSSWVNDSSNPAKISFAVLLSVAFCDFVS